MTCPLGMSLFIRTISQCILLVWWNMYSMLLEDRVDLVAYMLHKDFSTISPLSTIWFASYPLCVGVCRIARYMQCRTSYAKEPFMLLSRSWDSQNCTELHFVHTLHNIDLLKAWCTGQKYLKWLILTKTPESYLRSSWQFLRWVSKFLRRVIKWSGKEEHPSANPNPGCCQVKGNNDTGDTG